MRTKITLITILLISSLYIPALQAGTDVNININLPLIQVKQEPVMAVIPGTYIYFFSDNSVDFFFFGGYWWRLHGNRWYRANHYNGPWKFKHNKYVPAPFFKLAPGWKSQPFSHSGIKFQEMKNNWKQWEKEKRWDKKQDNKQVEKAAVKSEKNEKQEKNDQITKHKKGNPKGGKGK